MVHSDSQATLQQIIAHSKEYGFIFPSSEIYGHLQAVYDYGPYGVLLKDKVQRFWREALRQAGPRVVALDAAIFMDPRTWKASGHLAHFEDLFVDNKDSKKRYRVDALIEDHIEHLEQKKRTPSETQALKVLQKRYPSALADQDLNSLQALLKGICCSVSGTDNWGALRRLRLMFATEAGATTEDTLTLYLRPETAQGIYLNFLNVQKALRLKLPFGMAQIGKAFRNELIARQFTFRTREFTQMEMQFFVPEAETEHWFQYWQVRRLRWYEQLGIPRRALRLRPHNQLAHYAKAATDIEYLFPFGWKEVEGIHARGDFDLSQHAKQTGKRLAYFDPETEQHYLPHVIETSAGLDRICLMMLCEAYKQLQNDNKERIMLSLAAPFAPVQVGVFPLLRKEPLIKRAQALVAALKPEFEVAYEEAASIGKRYARQDLIGTPFCVTIDHQTLEDDTVTLRLRDNTEQLRLPAAKIGAHIAPLCSLKPLLAKLRAADT